MAAKRIPSADWRNRDGCPTYSDWHLARLSSQRVSIEVVVTAWPLSAAGGVWRMCCYISEGVMSSGRSGSILENLAPASPFSGNAPGGWICRKRREHIWWENRETEATGAVPWGCRGREHPPVCGGLCETHRATGTWKRSWRNVHCPWTRW